MNENIINSLEELTPQGGYLLFDKAIMYVWMKDRYVEKKEIDCVNQFSLKFLPIEKNSTNSFVEIYGDMKHFDDCNDYKIFSLIFKTRPTLKHHYENDDTVSFFQLKLKNKNNLTITCDSIDDRPFWFYNAELNDVKDFFNKPIRITDRKSVV